MTRLIDPSRITDYNRTTEELELFWLFALVVAGKTARTQASKLNEFLSKSPSSPFQYVEELVATGRLTEELQLVKMGQYSRLVRAFTESLSLDLKNDPLESFEAIYGVSHKTARFFLLHSRPDQRLAALDTHMLKYLRDRAHWSGKGAPTGKHYLRLEKTFIEYADANNMSVADFDLMIWNENSRKLT
jgi:hypothetical protein